MDAVSAWRLSWSGKFDNAEGTGGTKRGWNDPLVIFISIRQFLGPVYETILGAFQRNWRSGKWIGRSIRSE
jgi:hypothetical protein